MAKDRFIIIKKEDVELATKIFKKNGYANYNIAINNIGNRNEIAIFLDGSWMSDSLMYSEYPERYIGNSDYEEINADKFLGKSKIYLGGE